MKDVPQDDIKNEIVTYDLVFDAPNGSDKNVKECFDFILKMKSREEKST